MERTKRLKSGGPDLDSRGEFLVYLCRINRLTQREMGNSNRLGDIAGTYDHNRRPSKGEGFFGKIEMCIAEHFPVAVLCLGE